MTLVIDKNLRNERIIIWGPS